MEHTHGQTDIRLYLRTNWVGLNWRIFHQTIILYIFDKPHSETNFPLVALCINDKHYCLVSINDKEKNNKIYWIIHQYEKSNITINDISSQQFIGFYLHIGIFITNTSINISILLHIQLYIALFMYRKFRKRELHSYLNIFFLK